MVKGDCIYFEEKEKDTGWNHCINSHRLDNKDNLCGFTFTTNGFINLYKLQIGSFNDKLFKCQNKDLKILMIAGSDDPVIGNEKLFKRLKEFLTNVGYQNIESKLYNSLRHEIFNEDEYNEIYQDVLNFIEGV